MDVQKHYSTPGYGEEVKVAMRVVCSYVCMCVWLCRDALEAKFAVLRFLI